MPTISRAWTSAANCQKPRGAYSMATTTCLNKRSRAASSRFEAPTCPARSDPKERIRGVRPLRPLRSLRPLYARLLPRGPRPRPRPCPVNSPKPQPLRQGHSKLRLRTSSSACAASLSARSNRLRACPKASLSKASPSKASPSNANPSSSGHGPSRRPSLSPNAHGRPPLSNSRQGHLKRRKHRRQSASHPTSFPARRMCGAALS